MLFIKNTLEILENSEIENKHATTQKISSTCSAITFTSDCISNSQFKSNTTILKLQKIIELTDILNT
jgi:hypothetical protein